MNENLLSSFKKELGYVNNSNQFVELSIRITENDYFSEIENNLLNLAERYHLKISDLAENWPLRIRKSYIVNVYTCFNSFLIDFNHFPGSPTKVSKEKKTDDETWLSWTLKTAFPEIKDYSTVYSSGEMKRNINNDILICKYYHLIRNAIVHKGKNSAEIKNIRSRIVTDDDPRLKAPNELDSLTLDDQSLFSRAAISVASFIYNHSKYDAESIFEAHQKDLIRILSPFQEERSRSKGIAKVQRFFSTMYPHSISINWENEVLGFYDKLEK